MHTFILSNNDHMGRSESSLTDGACRQTKKDPSSARVVCKFRGGGNEFVSFRRLQFDRRTVHSCTSRVCSFGQSFSLPLCRSFWLIHRPVVKNNILLLCPQNSGCRCFRSQI